MSAVRCLDVATIGLAVSVIWYDGQLLMMPHCWIWALFAGIGESCLLAARYSPSSLLSLQSCWHQLLFYIVRACTVSWLGSFPGASYHAFGAHFMGTVMPGLDFSCWHLLLTLFAGTICVSFYVLCICMLCIAAFQSYCKCYTLWALDMCGTCFLWVSMFALRRFGGVQNTNMHDTLPGVCQGSTCDCPVMPLSLVRSSSKPSR